MKTTPKVLLGLGVVFLGVGCILAGLNYTLVRWMCGNIVPLRNVTGTAGDTYRMWAEPRMEVFIEFWIWEVLNPAEVRDLGSKPYLAQRGPFTYQIFAHKDIISWNHENTSVHYRQPHTFRLVRERSVASDLEETYTINVPLVTLATVIKDQPELARRAFSEIAELAGETLFKSVTVRELLWGYNDRLFWLVHHLLPSLAPDKFGLFYGMNTSDDGLFEVFDGTRDVDDFTRITRWNSARTLPFWGSAQANMINGTDGFTVKPMLTKKDVLQFYNMNFCRSMYFVFDAETSVQGIRNYRYTIPFDKVLANATEDPSQAGFCVGGTCLGAGVQSVAPCKQGAPIVLSAPHFYQAAPHYRRGVLGLAPHSREHATWLAAEPVSGYVCRGPTGSRSTSSWPPLKASRSWSGSPRCSYQ